MVKITVIGWYGTETIGDRAILAGIVNVFSEVFSDFTINLGTMFPFFTERTLIEDYSFLCYCAHKKEISINLFNTMKQKELKSAIDNCDLLVIGGGPFFDGYCMFMLEYAFRYAKKVHKKTMIFGNGVGPLYRKRFINSMINIVNHSDIVVFRDESSKNQYLQLSRNNKIVSSSIDPGVFAAQIFKEKNIGIIKNHSNIIANIIKFPAVYKSDCKIVEAEIDNKTVVFLDQIQRTFNKEMLLVPMHYFGVGGDDRIFMNEVVQQLNRNEIEVQNEPLALEETMALFQQSPICIGMRFHSIVLQTILCGKNIILDYTDPSTGKTSGFLNQINAFEHYKSHCVNLQQSNSVLLPIEHVQKFVIDNNQINFYKNIYKSIIKASLF